MRKRQKLVGVSLMLGIIVGLLVLICFLYVVFYMGVPLWGDRNFTSRFQQQLREYDALFEASKADSYLRNYASLEKKLRSLEKLNATRQFATLQTTLSLLKRERAFVKYEKNFQPRYENNLRAAEKKYPHTVQLQALSIESTLKNGIPTIQDALKLEDGRGSQFIQTFLSVIAEQYRAEEKELLLVDAALLSVTAAPEYRDPTVVLYPLDLRQAESMNTFRFAAEYAYDAGNFPLASRLFALIPYDDALERAGDALFLGDDPDGARELWLLSSNANSLYNYASLSGDPVEKMATLEKLLAQYSDPSQQSFLSGLILYTRLASEERAVAVLGASPYTAQIPLLDLELWRRTEKNYYPDRSLTELWRLIGRHVKDAQIYEYAAWYFGKSRRYEELALLLKNASLQGIDGKPLQYWRIMLDARSRDDHSTVRDALSALYEPAEPPWFARANAGRFSEAARSWQNAVDHYHRALAGTDNPQTKSRILQRIAACLAALGRNGESRSALEEAVSLDPANLSARSALNAR
jgi:tetratricopeptide (TPR) repeat protein